MKIILLTLLLAGCTAPRYNPQISGPISADPGYVSRYLQRKEAESDFTRFYWSHPEIYRRR